MTDNNEKQIALNELKQAYFPIRSALANLSRTWRERIGDQAGYAYGSDRDIFGALGYPASIQYGQYYAWFRRDPLARRIINAPVNAVWSTPPEISEDDKVDETTFEKEFKIMQKRVELWNYLKRADRMSRIGKYSILFLGFDGEDRLEDEPGPTNVLNYVRAYTENSAVIVEYEKDERNERYGKPLIYNLTPNNVGDLQDTASKVHWSRIIHIVNDPFESDIEGIPTLESVFNYLIAALQVVGGGAEAFWRLAFPGYGFIQDEGTTIADEDELTTKINDFIHKFQRYIAVSGFSDIKQFDPTMADPKNHLDVIIDLISAGTGIPKRILSGSEIGMASSQEDRMNWGDRVQEWRSERDPIIREFNSRLMKYGALPIPVKGEDEYQIIWPAKYEMTEGEKADVALKRTQTMGEYIFKNVETIYPLESFLANEIGLSDEEIKAIQKENEKQLKEEEEFNNKMDQDLDLIDPDQQGDESQIGDVDNV